MDVLNDSFIKVFNSIDKFIENPMEGIFQNKIRFGIVFAPIVNYHQGTNQSNITFSGGAFVEVPFLKNMDFYTGLLIIDQKIHFEENQLNKIKEGTQLKSKQAILTGLELPLNLKYNFTISDNQ